jgi:hypothetical protein
MGFTYIPEQDIFIHLATSFVFAGDYIVLAHNDEIKNKFYDATGYVLDDFAIGMMRARAKDGQAIHS